MINTLFGAENESSPDSQEWFIKQKDSASFEGRVKRLKYLHKLNPEGKQLMGSLEIVNGYREMQWCYIEGFYLAVIVLSQSLIEKILHDRLLLTPGIKKVDVRTLSSMLAFIKKEKLLHDFWINKIEHIREIRNPITHLKPFGHKDNADVRSYYADNSIEKQLELDAKDALEVATHFSISKLNNIF